MKIIQISAIKPKNKSKFHNKCNKKLLTWINTEGTQLWGPTNKRPPSTWFNR
jgi:hypothetical protein